MLTSYGDGLVTGRLAQRVEQRRLSLDHLSQNSAGRSHQISHVGSCEGVHDSRSVPGRYDDARPTEYTELMGQVRRLNSDLIEQLPHLARSIAEKLENADADRMPENPEELGLPFVKRRLHIRN